QPGPRFHHVAPMPFAPMRLSRLILALLVAVALLAGGLGGVRWLWTPGPPLPQPALVTVAAGNGRWSLARHLADAGVVRHALGFDLWSLLHRHRTFKPGVYQFPGGEAVATVATAIWRGQIYTVAFTVPEGYNRFEIARELERRGLARAADFLAATADPTSIRDLDPASVSLEGYLFPATYRVPYGAPVAHIVALMTARFRQETRRNPPPGGDLHNWVTLASLVEKETGAPEERALIAGVFMNRLEQGMPLQCDPTVIYAAVLAGRFTGDIHRDDLKFDSPYNTYLHSGLPPGPIANPGRAALLAAAHPDATRYIYFVSDGHGAHRFARTLAEQEKNVHLYLLSLRAATPISNR
ncbi:MAG: endolytic transglycosylase MltG, partial [Terriglobales bacterium]